MKKRLFFVLALVCVLLSGCLVKQKPVYRHSERPAAPASGWVEENGQTYHYQEGVRDIGWYVEGDEVYYLDPETDGAATEGWITALEGTFYLHDKTLAIGWTEVDGQNCYFDEYGRLCTGLTEIDGQRFFLSEDGTPATGWVEQDGKRSYLREDGAMAVGWTEIDGKTYYFDENGIMARGKKEIDGQNCFFTSTGAQIMLVNRWNPVPEDYEVDLQNTGLGFYVDGSCVEPLKQMMSDCRAAGNSPLIISAYRSYWDQVQVFNEHLNEIKDYNTTITIAAIPGTSEHQLGLAVDIVDSSYTGLTRGQSTTKVQQWLMAHCWDYGFILRYTEDSSDITGIIYEPWHYRYVGLELAQEMKELGVCLEEYIDNLTDDGTTCGGSTAMNN